METQTYDIKFAGFRAKAKLFVNAITEDLKKIGSKAEKLNGVTFVELMAEEFNGQSRYLQDFAGIDIANQILRDNPERKIILVECQLPLNIIRKQRPEIDLLLSKKNVCLGNIGFWNDDSLEEINRLLTIFDEKVDGTEDQLCHYLANNELQKVTGEILHDFQKAKDVYNPTSENEQSMVTHGISKAKNYFPSLRDKTDKEILDFILSVKREIKEVMAGQSIDGVYCDVEGTILVDGLPNVKVTKMLSIREKEGKNITLWTGGNLEEIQELLNKAGIFYPLKSKCDFAGAIAEIVIDNDDENTFFAKTKIHPKTFIKV